MIRLRILPPYPEEAEIGSVWVVLPGKSSERYEVEGVEITGPVPGAKARRVLDQLQFTFEKLGFVIIVETDYP